MSKYIYKYKLSKFAVFLRYDSHNDKDRSQSLIKNIRAVSRKYHLWF